MIKTWLPKNVDPARLGRDAERHAFELDCDRDRLGASDDVPTDRLVVNFLRHQHTDYDEDQTQERHRQACEAIARRFSWLAEECERQIERRARSERESEDMAAEYERQQRERQAERRGIAEKSRQVIRSMEKFQSQPGFVVQAYRFALDPNATQQAALRSPCGAPRTAYNLGRRLGDASWWQRKADSCTKPKNGTRKGKRVRRPHRKSKHTAEQASAETSWSRPEDPHHPPGPQGPGGAGRWRKPSQRRTGTGDLHQDTTAQLGSW